jgi:hypothetical protein
MQVSALYDARLSGNPESLQPAAQEIGTLPRISKKLEIKMYISMERPLGATVGV